MYNIALLRCFKLMKIFLFFVSKTLHLMLPIRTFDFIALGEELIEP